MITIKNVILTIHHGEFSLPRDFYGIFEFLKDFVTVWEVMTNQNKQYFTQQIFGVFYQVQGIELIKTLRAKDDLFKSLDN
jgi:hypothetical protein